MKKVVSICLIVCVLLQATSQLWITFLFNINRNYIAANLCVNRFDAIPLCKGACYLEQQLEKDNKKQNDQPNLKTREIILFFECSPVVVPLLGHFATQDVCFNLFPMPHIITTLPNGIFRPPIYFV